MESTNKKAPAKLHVRKGDTVKVISEIGRAHV